MNFKSKNIVIIGGSSGIGRGTAESFIEKGANVCITGTRESIDDYDEDITENIKKCFYRKLDLSETDNLKNLSLPFKNIHTLVCSQGIVAYDRKEFEIDTFKKIIDLNLNSVMASCSFFHENLVRNKGSIVIIGSGASYHAVKGNPAYSASKGGVVGMTLPIARDLSVLGIRVNTVAPGLIDTPIYGEGEASEQFKSHLGQSVLFPKRLGSGEELAFMVMDLITNPYMNGETIRVDGGIRMPPK